MLRWVRGNAITQIAVLRPRMVDLQAALLKGDHTPVLYPLYMLGEVEGRVHRYVTDGAQRGHNTYYTFSLSWG